MKSTVLASIAFPTMPPTIPFNQLLEIIETLSPEELDDLINIVRKRPIDRNRFDRSFCFHRPIVLDREEKEAFLELVKRPARVNEKLLSAFRSL